MIDTPITTREDLPPEAISARDWSPWWRRLALVAVTLISAFMNFYQLGTNGWANTYYAAAIRSMLDKYLPYRRQHHTC